MRLARQALSRQLLELPSISSIVGVYGMNFDNPDSPWAMPELRWYYGYPLVWLLIIAAVVGMLLFFRRKNWF